MNNLINYNNKSLTFSIIKWATFVCFLLSSFCWIVKYFPNPRFYLIPLNILLIFYLKFVNIQIKDVNKFLILTIILLSIGLWSSFTSKNLFEWIDVIFIYSPAVIIYLYSKKDKTELLRFITKAFSIIIFISILIYLLAFIVNLPNLGYYKIDGDDFYPTYINYLFYIKSTSFEDFYRFNGPFREPGHFAIIAVFLIYANRYNFKNNNSLKIILFGLILSLSLAGWVLYIVGLAVLNINKMKRLSIGILGVSIIFLFFINYNGGDNVINQLIIQRLAFDKEKGIVGNNRFNQKTDYYFEKIKESDDFWIGNEEDAIKNHVGGAGYKIYIIRKGFISALLVLLLYIYLMPKNVDRIYGWGFITIVILCFLQRAYPFWLSWLIPFVLGTGINISYPQRKIDHNF